MIYPPAKWIDTQIGGYYLKPTNLIRIIDQSLQEDAAKRADLSKLYDILDNISRVPWRVNTKVMNVVM
jgi:DNA-directed RNA polymerase